jgi:outer membrane receptor for ferrienterochelin and colicin
MLQKRTLFFVLLLGIIGTRDGFGQSDELRELSIEELMQAQVISSTQTYVRLPEAPSSVFMVTGDQIRRWGIRRISELLERLVPGATSSEDQDETIAGFRGISADTNLKVLILLNGHEYNTQWNNGATSELELGLMDDIKKVEVLIGPHSALYGSGALIGVINIITKTGLDFSGVRATGNYGTGTYVRGELIAGKDVNDDLNYFVSAGGLAADGYENNHNGELNISRFPASWRFFGNVNYKHWDFMSRYARSSRALYYLRTSPTALDRWTNFDTFFANARRTFELSDNLRLDANFSYDTIQTQRHDLHSDLKIRAVGEDRYNAKLTSFYSGWNKHQLVLGASYRRDEFGSDWEGDNFNFNVTLKDGIPTNMPTDLYAVRNFTPYGRNVYALFGQDSIRLQDNLSVLIGFRFDRIEAPQIKHPNLFSPRLAFVYTPNKKTVLKAMLTSGVSRVAQASNTSPDPISLGQPSVFEADKSEKMHSIEIAGSYSPNARLDLSANVFYNSLRDIFGLDPARPPAVPPNANQPIFLISSGRIDYVGFEAVISANLNDRTFLRALHQHVQLGSVVDDPYGLLTTPDGHLNIYPENITKVLVECRLKNFNVNMNSNLVWNEFGVSQDRKQTFETGFYTLLNANLVWNVNPAMDVIFSGYNLLNYKKQISPFNLPMTGTPGRAYVAERNFNVSLSYRF